ncbi:hypothetical protein [Azospirillum endophyticum]
MFRPAPISIANGRRLARLILHDTSQTEPVCAQQPPDPVILEPLDSWLPTPTAP